MAPSRRVGLALVGLSAALAALATMPGVAAADIHIRPAFICATYDATNTTADVRLAGVNADESPEDEPVGADDFFEPLNPDQGQPAVYDPGYTPFDVDFTASTTPVTWILLGVSLPITLDPAVLPFDRPCPDRGPAITAVLPVQLGIGGGAQTVTVFGEGLAQTTATIVGVGAAATASATTTNRADFAITVPPSTAPGAYDLLITDAQGEEVGCKGCVVLVSSLPTGPAGATGAAGPTGPTGPPGPAGESSPAAPTPVRVNGHAHAVPRTAALATSVSCAAGATVISGGYALSPSTGADPPRITVDHAVGTRKWRVVAVGSGARGYHLTVSATCLL